MLALQNEPLVPAVVGGGQEVIVGREGGSLTSLQFQGKVGGYPCGHFSDTSGLKLLKRKGSTGHASTVCVHNENQNQVTFYVFVVHEFYICFWPWQCFV